MLPKNKKDDSDVRKKKTELAQQVNSNVEDGVLRPRGSSF